MRGHILLILMLAGILLTPTPIVTAESGYRVLTHAGLSRTYYHHVPDSYSAENPTSLIIALHPFASSGRAMSTLTGLDAASEASGFIVAYPDAFDLTWNMGRADSAYPTELQTTDDTGFILALIEELSALYTIDRDDIHLVGLAHGGAMAYRLACEASEQFASVAVYGATLWDFQPEQCGPARGSTSLFIAIGDQDVATPPAGRILIEAEGDSPALSLLSLSDTRDFWLARHNCPPTPTNTYATDTAAVFAGCDNDNALTIWQVPGTGHMWPRSGTYALNPTKLNFTSLLVDYWQGGIDWAALTPPDSETSTPLRNYTYYLPPDYDPANPLPVVIALHGRPGNGSGMAYLFDMNRFAADERYIAVYPDGLENEWNYVRGFQGFPNTGVDDIAFLDALIDDLAHDVSIDHSRIYIAGFSNGGFMAQRVACEAPDDYAGFAVFGASLFPGFPDLCEQASPRPMLFVHGTRDISIPWEGVRQGNLLLAYPVLDTIAFWLEHNECAPDISTRELMPSIDSAPTTFARHYAFESCASGQPIEFYAIEGGGHNLPGIPNRIDGEIAGAVNMDVHAANITWQFFSKHALPLNQP